MEIRDYIKPSPETKPLIYAYIAHDGVGKPVNEGYIKIGYTTKRKHNNNLDNALERIKEQTHTPGLKPTVLGVWDAFDVNGNVDPYDGVTLETLSDGYIRVTFDMTKLTKWNGSPSSVINFLYIRGAWTDASGYIDNIQFA